MSKRRQNNKMRQQEAIPHKAATVVRPAGKSGDMVPWWLMAVPAVAVLVYMWLALSCFPETERMMEALNFFVWTPECMAQKLAAYPGGTRIMADWLVQFCKDPTTGVLIESLLLGLMTLFAAMVPRAWGHKAWVPFSIVPAVGLAFIALHRPSVSIQGIFFFAALVVAGYAYRKCRPAIFLAVVAIVGMVSVWMVSFPVAVMLLLGITALQLVVRGRGVGKRMRMVCLLLPVLLVVLTIVFVKVSSSCLGYIPSAERWWYIPDVDGSVLGLVVLLAVPVVVMFVPQKGGTVFHASLTVVLSIVAGVVCYSHITDNEQSRQSEDVYRYSAMAERGEWQALLSDINSRGAIENNVLLQFALLAEARLGTLPENIFNYPINTPETFCPRLETNPLSSDFCRIFYRELGFYDEAFHQAFQYGMMVSRTSGFCAASLRHMAEYSVCQGDRPLAEKYLYLLERTSNNGEFVAEQRQLLANSKTTPDSTVLRADNFAKAYAFASEMAHFLDYDRNNRPALDYLLCSLLLTKRLEVFKTVLNDFADRYDGIYLPRAYAEAAAMINHLQPTSLSPVLQYAPEYDRQFEQFIQLHNSGQDDSAFRGTFWYYYVYAQIPPQQEWIQQSQSS